MACLFCRIAANELPHRRVYEDDTVVAFEDIQPQAPVHLLVIPRRHIATLNDVTSADDALLGRLQRVASELAASRGVAAQGYRVVLNCKAGAGQSVFHLHVHVLGGRRFSWPPG